MPKICLWFFGRASESVIALCGKCPRIPHHHGVVRVYSHPCGQIIATSHDLTPNGGLVREIPLFQGNLGW